MCLWQYYLICVCLCVCLGHSASVMFVFGAPSEFIVSSRIISLWSHGPLYQHTDGNTILSFRKVGPPRLLTCLTWHHANSVWATGSHVQMHRIRTHVSVLTALYFTYEACDVLWRIYISFGPFWLIQELFSVPPVSRCVSSFTVHVYPYSNSLSQKLEVHWRNWKLPVIRGLVNRAIFTDC